MKSNYKPLIVAVFLVVVGLTSGNYYSSKLDNIGVKVARYSPGLIGVAQAESPETSDSVALLEGSGLVINGTMDGQVDADQSNLATSLAATANANTAIQDPGQPVGEAVDPSQALQYKVKKGDTLSGVAAHFNISVATILSANPNMRKKSLQVGSTITIPGAGTSDTNTLSSASGQNLPNFNSDFIMPTQGDDRGILDSSNGIEIINSCGTPVVAAADGIVVPDNNIAVTADGWNGGYGNFILIEHAFGNNIFTRYAHLEKSTVQIGDYVKQGQEIGLIGQTGGASACELDFEVIGAQNPFAK